MTYGMLRVKNEARWIERVIRSIYPICERIFVFDDHSTDDTVSICENLDCTVIRSPFEGIHEARDKDFLLAEVWKAGAQIGDYCLMVDGDEALDSRDVPALTDVIMAGRVTAGTMHVVYLWDREDQIRVDRWYEEFRRPSLFRLTDRNLTFKRTEYGGNFHCSSAPAQLLDDAVPLPVRLLHYGYLHKEDRVRKFHWYNSIDPDNDFEDRYRHMVVGDLFPSESVFKWAGPLRVRPL